MRIVRPVFLGLIPVLAAFGLIAVLAAFASPVFAKDASLGSHANANARAVEEAPASQGCHAYQQAADGSWVELTCHEGSEAAPAPARGKSASRGSSQTAH